MLNTFRVTSKNSCNVLVDVLGNLFPFWTDKKWVFHRKGAEMQLPMKSTGNPCTLPSSSFCSDLFMPHKTEVSSAGVITLACHVVFGKSEACSSYVSEETPCYSLKVGTQRKSEKD